MDMQTPTKPAEAITAYELPWPVSEVLIDLTTEPATVHLRDKSLALSFEPDPLWKRIAIRTMDLAIAVSMLVATAPLMILLAVIIKATSPGPALYLSPRIGHRGAEFKMLKLRSMVPNAETMVLPGTELSDTYEAEGFKIRNDPRITAVGRVIRKTSLDELPQLFNIIRGEMSICGPRPKIASECERYGAAIDTVLRVRPGLTGRWQVSGRNSLPFDERIMMDVDYALTRTIPEDIRIILRTATQMVGGSEGAY